MKLEAMFKILEKTAFGPWLAAFKKLFTKEELEQEISKIQPDELNEYDKKISELNDEKMKLNYEPIATSEIDRKIAKLEKEAKNISCKELLILRNGVIEVKDNVVVVAGDVRRIEKYKANINLSFNKIANKQMEDFYKLVTQLPENHNEWAKYLHMLEKDKGYSPTKAIKEVAEINRLVKKFEQSPNKKYHDDYRLVEENTNKLLEYIHHLPQEPELIGQEPAYIMISCM